MNVFLESPHLLIRESLVAVLEQHHKVTDESEADVAIKDIRGSASYLPEPSKVPTLALICAEAQANQAVEVMRCGYQGYLGSETSIEQLEQALQALLRGGTWAERRVLAQM